ncbi:MAG: hypothetical protein ACYCUM_07865 [Solirubrobacteraceae bacterium]
MAWRGSVARSGDGSRRPPQRTCRRSKRALPSPSRCSAPPRRARRRRRSVRQRGAGADQPRPNRRTDTGPELLLRSALQREGLRFREDHRLDLEGLRVRVDVAFPRRRLAVFVDGCFWHRCPQHGSPAARTSTR